MKAPRNWFNIFLRDHGYVAILLGAFALWCTWSSVSFHAQAQSVAQDGVPVLGRLVDKRAEESATTTRYVLTYRFSKDGARALQDVAVTKAEFDRAPDGLTVSEIFLPTDDPKLIAAREAALQRDADAMRNWALWSGLLALGMGAWSGRTATRLAMARRWGREEDAYVTQRNVSYATKGPAKVHLKFRSHSGTDGSSLMRYEFNMPSLDRGDMIRVFVHRGRAWWVEDTGPRLHKPQTVPGVTRKPTPKAPKPRVRHTS